MAKYSVPDDHWEEDEEELDETSPAVTADIHLKVYDERDSIERYNGFEWWFLVEDGTIVGVEKGHYCPSRGHIDPMGPRGWSDVPEQVQREVLRQLNVRDASEVVDIERTEELADDRYA